jgi:formylglycine-generating enzyme required for sulfatase activity
VDGTPLYDEDVCIPGGAFLLGSADGAALSTITSGPERIAVIPTLYVDRYEVTVGRWRAAIASGFHPLQYAIPNDGAYATSGSGEGTTRCTYSSAPLEGAANRETFPLNCVSYVSARAFCNWLGGDLLTEASWEYVAAAAGRTLETRYAWGSSPPRCEGQIYARHDVKITGATSCYGAGFPFGPRPVNESEAGDATPTAGLVGLGGSMMEFARDARRGYDTRCWAAQPLFDPQCLDEAEPMRAVRGAGWDTNALQLVAAVRGVQAKKTVATPGGGFRCARLVGGS